MENEKPAAAEAPAAAADPAIAPPPLEAGAPDLGAPALGQTHALEAAPLEAGTPSMPPPGDAAEDAAKAEAEAAERRARLEARAAAHTKIYNFAVDVVNGGKFSATETCDVVMQVAAHFIAVSLRDEVAEGGEKAREKAYTEISAGFAMRLAKAHSKVLAAREVKKQLDALALAIAMPEGEA